MNAYTSMFTDNVVISLTSSTYAYVTYQDIKQLGNLRDQTVIVVKAPTDTKLEVADPDEVRTRHTSWSCCGCPGDTFCFSSSHHLRLAFPSRKQLISDLPGVDAAN